MDATEKYSPALAKSSDKTRGLGHAKDGIGVDMQGLPRNGRDRTSTDRTSTGKEAHWRAMEVQRWKRIEGRWKCIARAKARQNNARHGHGMDS